jgi:hypothetical protein
MRWRVSSSLIQAINHTLQVCGECFVGALGDFCLEACNKLLRKGGVVRGDGFEQQPQRGFDAGALHGVSPLGGVGCMLRLMRPRVY